MERYNEQTVISSQTFSQKLCYVLAWILIVFAALMCCISLANFMGTDSEGALSLNWIALGIALVGAAAVFALMKLKDHFNIEYDYILNEGELRIDMILNHKRRKRLLKLDVDKISRVGDANESSLAAELNRPGVKADKWYLHTNEPLYAICFTEGSQRRIVLTEMNEDMRKLLGFELKRVGIHTQNAIQQSL